jgi:hypothetical protein
MVLYEAFTVPYLICDQTILARVDDLLIGVDSDVGEPFEVVSYARMGALATSLQHLLARVYDVQPLLCCGLIIWSQ